MANRLALRYKLHDLRRMNITYRPIGTDWPGQRTPNWERAASRFRRQGRYEGAVGDQRWVMPQQFQLIRMLFENSNAVADEARRRLVSRAQQKRAVGEELQLFILAR